MNYQMFRWTWVMYDVSETIQYDYKYVQYTCPHEGDVFWINMGHLWIHEEKHDLYIVKKNRYTLETFSIVFRVVKEQGGAPICGRWPSSLN
jgi:hypothetical protein